MESPLAAHLPRHSSHAPPPGRWVLETHQNGPVVASIEPMLAGFCRGFAAGFAHWGFPLAGMSHTLIDGWLYLSAQDLTDPVEVARRMCRVEEVGDLVELRTTAKEWMANVLPSTDGARRRVAPGRLTDRSDAELVDALLAASTLLVEFAERRMTVLPGVNLLTSAFLVDGEAAGLTRAACLAHLAGSSRSTTALARDAGADDDRALRNDELADEYADELLSPDGAQRTLADVDDGWWRSGVVPDVPVVGALPPGLTGTLADARMAQDVREASRELFLRLQGRAQRIATELGRRLTAGGVLGSAQDVIYLTPAELVSAASGDLAGPAVKALVRSRHHDVAVAASITPEQVIGSPVPIDVPAGPAPQMGEGAMRTFVLAMRWLAAIDGEPGAVPSDDTSVLRGVPASPGVATAPARVVIDVDDLVAVEPGEILVCGTTTPAWCVAISRCAGVVATGGGDISHTAIVAREFAIPAVVGVAGAARLLRTGDVVTVDGSVGTVAIRRG